LFCCAQTCKHRRRIRADREKDNKQIASVSAGASGHRFATLCDNLDMEIFDPLPLVFFPHYQVQHCHALGEIIPVSLWHLWRMCQHANNLFKAIC
jgi:hypothetical protein